MKKVLFASVACSFFFSVNSFAQDFAYPVGQSVDTDLPPTIDYVGATISMLTPDSSAITFGWEKISNTLPIGWDYSMCDYTTCYPGVPDNATMTTLTYADFVAGDLGFLKVTASSLGIEGAGSVVIYVYDITDHDIGDTVIFNFSTPAAGLQQETSSVFVMYPNPASDEFNIVNPLSAEVEFIVYDITGKALIIEKIQPKASALIPAEDWNDGIYFVSLRSADGSFTSTGKLIIR